MKQGYLIVRVAGAAFGLPVSRVLEVGDLGEVLDVPRSLPAVRRPLFPPDGASRFWRS